MMSYLRNDLRLEPLVTNLLGEGIIPEDVVETPTIEMALTNGLVDTSEVAENWFIRLD